MREEHTATPWAHEGREIVTDWKGGGGRVIVIAAHGSISHAPMLKLGDDDWDLQMVNLAFIAKACNAHDALAAAITTETARLMESITVGDLVSDPVYVKRVITDVSVKLRAALKLAEGKQTQ